MAPRLFGVRLAPRARVIAAILTILAFTPEMKLRVRSAEAAFSGVIDLQVLMELAIWALIGVWALAQVSRGLTDGRYVFSELGLPSRAMLVLASLIVLSAATAFSVRSLARAMQFAILSVFMLIVVWESHRDEAFLPETWHELRRMFVGVVLAAMAISAAVPLWPPLIDVDGYARYRWFSVHPIEVSGMTAVALIMVAGAILGSQRRAWRRYALTGAFLILATLFAALVATRTRSALGAALVAGAILVLMTRSRHWRRVAGLGGLIAVLVLIAVLSTPSGSEIADRVVTRGQTAAQLESLSQRTEIIDIALTLYHERPLLGYGYQQPGPILTTYYPWAGHGHNIFVEGIMALGTVGVVIILGLILVSIGVFVSARRNRQRTRLDDIAPGVLAAFVVVLTMGVTSPSIAGNVGYEACVMLWFAVFADAYLYHTRIGVGSPRSE